jgi:hypothetical protein
MGSSTFLDYLSSSAVSLTVSGNTGISPFLTLFLLGIVEISDPTLLNMGTTIESIVASWYSIAVLGFLTVLELIAKCIPFLDEMIDSIEIFIVPLFSIVGSLGTLGLLDLVVAAGGGGGGEGESDNDDYDYDKEVNEQQHQQLDEDERSLSTSSSDTYLTVLKVFLVLMGIGLSICIHLFKMLIRVTGLVGCAGLCQPCITVLEVTVVCCGVLFAIYIQPIAIILCSLLLICAIYAIHVTWCRKKVGDDNEDGTPIHNPSNNNNNLSEGRPTNEPSDIGVVVAVNDVPTSNVETRIGDDGRNHSTKRMGVSSNQQQQQPQSYDEENPHQQQQQQQQHRPPLAESLSTPLSLSRLTPMAPPPTKSRLH